MRLTLLFLAFLLTLSSTFAQDPPSSKATAKAGKGPSPSAAKSAKEPSIKAAPSTKAPSTNAPATKAPAKTPTAAKTVKEAAKKAAKSFKTAIARRVCDVKALRELAAFESLDDAMNSYHDALLLIPKVLASKNEQERKNNTDDLEMVFTTIKTSLNTAALEAKNDVVGWRKGAIYFRVSWLQLKVKILQTLVFKLPRAEPRWRWLAKLKATAYKALNWLWSRTDPEARKKRSTLSAWELKVTRNLKLWIDGAVKELQVSREKLVSSFCSRVVPQH